MSGKFTLEITLGNAAMEGPRDVAEALNKVAEKLSGNAYGTPLHPPTEGTIRDLNGNTVGKWAVTPEED